MDLGRRARQVSKLERLAALKGLPSAANLLDVGNLLRQPRELLEPIGGGLGTVFPQGAHILGRGGDVSFEVEEIR